MGYLTTLNYKGYTIVFIKAYLYEILIIKDFTYFNTSGSNKKHKRYH
jgi:hypothetical protein